MTATEDDELVTKGYLRNELGAMEGRMEQRFDQRLQATEQRLNANIAQAVEHVLHVSTERLQETERRMKASMAETVQHALQHALAVSDERMRAWFASLDDKYAPLPPRVTQVERAMEEHKGDYTLHKRPRGR